LINEKKLFLLEECTKKEFDSMEPGSLEFYKAIVKVRKKGSNA
jgi:hypothetical protein